MLSVYHTAWVWCKNVPIITVRSSPTSPTGVEIFADFAVSLKKLNTIMLIHILGVRTLPSNPLPETYQFFIVSGILLIIIGVILVLLPIIANYLPSMERLENLPPILIYVYRSENFYFITSPILILISLILLILYIIK